jgi:hypothetical protein
MAADLYVIFEFTFSVCKVHHANGKPQNSSLDLI